LAPGAAAIAKAAQYFIHLNAFLPQALGFRRKEVPCRSFQDALLGRKGPAS
jgi:hypothetical protein